MAKKAKVVRPQEVNWYILVPVIVFVAIVPLIVHMKSIPLEGAAFEFWKSEQVNSDLFSYYKSLFIIICAVISTVTIGFMLRYQKLKIKRLLSYIPIGILGLCIIASAILAEYPKVAWLGFPDRYEGALVLVSYLVMCYVIINALQTEREHRIVFISIMASAVIIALIGISQFVGWDIFMSGIGQSLISPSANDTSFTSNSVYSTLYNSNYVGSYMAMLLPLTLVFYLSSSKTWVKVLTGIVSILIFATLLGCYSRAGYVGASIALIIGLFMLRDVLRREWKSALVIALSLLLVFALMNNYDSGRASESFNSIISGREVTESDTGDWQWVVSSIPIDFANDDVIIYGKIPLRISIGSDEQVHFFDNDNKELPFVQQNSQLVLKDERYKCYTVEHNDKLLSLYINGHILYFKNIDDRMIPVDQHGEPITLYSTVQGNRDHISIKIDGKEMIIEADNTLLFIRAEGMGINFIDEDGQPLNFVQDDRSNQYYLDDYRYDKYKFSIKDNRLSMQINTTVFHFLWLGDFFLPINDITPAIKDIRLSEDEVVLYGDNTQLSIINKNKQLVFKDERTRILPFDVYSFGHDFYVINDYRYVDFIISVHEDALQIEKGRKKILLLLTESGYKYVNAAGKEIDIVAAESYGFEGRETIGSSRGYIWSRTIPLLKDTLMVGHGPDTFPIYFPQNDVEAKFRFLDSTTMLVDKPHNIYLQMAVNTGIISLLAFIVLIVGYLISSFKKCLTSNYSSFQDIGRLAVFLSIIGYLMTGVFNDSIVSVAPVFWGLLGLGINLNHRYMSQERRPNSLS